MASRAGWPASISVKPATPTADAATDATSDATTSTDAAGAQTTETPAADATAETDVTADAAAIATLFPTGSYVFIAGDGEPVNLRADASTESDIVTQLADGAVGTVDDAPVIGEDYDWYPVTFGTGDAAVTGYVAGEFLTGGITVGADATVAEGPLNVRETASTEGDPLGQLETGATVTIVSGPTEAEDIVWFEITSGDLTGFVAGRYLEAPPPRRQRGSSESCLGPGESLLGPFPSSRPKWRDLSFPKTRPPQILFVRRRGRVCPLVTFTSAVLNS